MTGNWTDAPVVVLQAGGEWRRYANPSRIIVAGEPAEVAPALVEIERAVEDEGLFAAGYMAYEAGAAFGLTVRDPYPESPPLLWFGLYRDFQPVNPPSGGGEYRLGDWRPSLSYAAYENAIGRIKAAIAAGDTYQANYTFQLRSDFTGDPWGLFAVMAAAQRSRYCACIDLGRYVICSASPELFFHLDGTTLTSRPMKGTAPRGLTADEDRRQIEWLRNSEKNRAENVMIVDMIRNDFGRVARTGSVRVPSLFDIERYPTLLQMTSTVTAETDATLPEILAATFPCASITGAPKVRTMRIITELEPEPRGVYTGAIGTIAPGRRVRFNVAIRTAVIDRECGHIAYGVGSGVVWDSDAASEYAECLLKARVLQAQTDGAADFQLIETMRWMPGEGYYLPGRHLDRLRESAGYFGFHFDSAAVETALAGAAAGLDEPSKVRLLLDREGRIEINARPLTHGIQPAPLRVGLARLPVDSSDVRLYHKTTRREVYDAARASRPDADDVILWNERGELTESTIANVVLEIDGRRLTPPVSAGLLPGTLRAHLLESGEIEEHTLTRADLDRATGLWLINSVRGSMSAVIIPLQNDSSA